MGAWFLCNCVSRLLKPKETILPQNLNSGSPSMLNIKTHAILYLDYAVILDITIILTLHINLS